MTLHDPGPQQPCNKVGASSLSEATRVIVLHPAYKKRREIHWNLSSQPSVGAVGEAVELARCNSLVFLAQIAQASQYPAQTARRGATGVVACCSATVQ